MTTSGKTLSELMEEAKNKAVTTAFIIYQTTDGQWIADPDTSKELEPERPATLDDILGGTAAVHSGCTSQQTAMSTIMFMEQRAAAAAQQMRAQQESANIASILDPKKLRNPNA